MSDGAFGNLNNALQNLAQYNIAQQTASAAGAGLTPFGNTDGSGGSGVDSGSGGSGTGSDPSSYGQSGVPVPKASPLHVVAGASQAANAKNYFSTISDASKQTGVPINVGMGVLNIESGGFRPDIVNGQTKSPKGAIGIGQFMPATAKQFGIDPTDPTHSIYATFNYLKQNYDKAVANGLSGGWMGPAGRRAVSMYNTGPDATFVNTDYVKSVYEGKQGLWGAGTWQQAIDKGMFGDPSKSADVAKMAQGDVGEHVPGPGAGPMPEDGWGAGTDRDMITGFTGSQPGINPNDGVDPGTLSRSDVNASPRDINAMTPGSVMDKVQKGTATWDELSPQQQQALTQKFGASARARFEASQKNASVSTASNVPLPTVRPDRNAPGDIAGTGRDQPYQNTPDQNEQAKQAALDDYRKAIVSGDKVAAKQAWDRFQSLNPEKETFKKIVGKPSTSYSLNVFGHSYIGDQPKGKDEPVPSGARPLVTQVDPPTKSGSRSPDDGIRRPTSASDVSVKGEDITNAGNVNAAAREALKADSAIGGDSGSPKSATSDTPVSASPDSTPPVKEASFTPGDGSKADKTHAETIGLNPNTGMPKGYDPREVYPPGFTLPQLIYNIKKANPNISNASLARAIMYLSPLLNQASQSNYHMAQLEERNRALEAQNERFAIGEEGKNTRAANANATRLTIAQSTLALRKQEFDARQSQQWKEFVGKQDLATKRLVISEARLKEQIYMDQKRLEQGATRIQIQQANARLKQWEDLNNQLNKAISQKSQTAGSLGMDEETRKQLLAREEERYQAVKKQIEQFRSGMTDQDLPTQTQKTINADDLIKSNPVATIGSRG